LAHLSTDTITVGVSDEGPGFQWPADPQNTRSAPTGTGLRLVVVDNLMQQSNGRLQIEPRTDRAGTNVWLTWVRATPVEVGNLPPAVALSF